MIRWRPGLGISLELGAWNLEFQFAQLPRVQTCGDHFSGRADFSGGLRRHANAAGGNHLRARAIRRGGGLELGGSQRRPQTAPAAISPEEPARHHHHEPPAGDDPQTRAGDDVDGAESLGSGTPARRAAFFSQIGRAHV